MSLLCLPAFGSAHDCMLSLIRSWPDLGAVSGSEMGHRRLANPPFCGIPILEKADFGASPFLKVPILGHRPFRRGRFCGIEIVKRRQKGSSREERQIS